MFPQAVISPRSFLRNGCVLCLLLHCMYSAALARQTTSLDVVNNNSYRAVELIRRQAPDPNSGSGNSPQPQDNNNSPTQDVMNPDDMVIDPLTPAGKVKFTFPKSYVRPDDMTIFPVNQVMTIKWDYVDVAIMPRIITIQINSPGVASKLKGSNIQTPDDRWFPVALNVSGNRDQYQWLVNVTDRAGYQLRLFDSEIGPVYFGKPGRLGLTISSKFNVYIEGRDPSYLEMFDNSASGELVWMLDWVLSTSGMFGLFVLSVGSLMVYGYWL